MCIRDRREPGFTHKETIKTGSLAAAKGGFTTICAMPNTEPTIDTVESLINFNRIINKDAVINILPIGAISKNRLGRKIAPLSSMHKNGIVALSDDGDHLDDESIRLKQCRNQKTCLYQFHNIAKIIHLFLMGIYTKDGCLIVSLSLIHISEPTRPY